MKEYTIILIKHDGVQRGLVGEIITRFENKGLRLAGMKLIHATKAQADRHYVLTPEFIEKLGNNTRRAYAEKGQDCHESNEEIAKRVKSWNITYLTEGPIIALLFDGYHAIEIGRKLVGHAEARQAAIGTIRGDFTVESYEMADNLKRPLRNIVHASGNKEEAMNEKNVWFKDEEIYDYEFHKWKVMH